MPNQTNDPQRSSEHLRHKYVIKAYTGFFVRVHFIRKPRLDLLTKKYEHG